MVTTKALSFLRRSTADIISGETKVSVAYSGGLDSSIVAAVAREFATVRCYTCFVTGSHDARTVGDRAKSESLDLVVTELTSADVPMIVRETVEMLGTSNPMQVAYTIPIFAALKESQEKLMLTGSGADELFGGYAKYSKSNDPSQMMEEDLRKMLCEGEALTEIACTMGKSIGFPFVSEEMIRFSRALPFEEKISSSERKVLLRDVARLLGLPSHDLPKKAAQYSSGVLREMKRQAKSNHKSLADWTRSLTDDRGRSS